MTAENFIYLNHQAMINDLTIANRKLSDLVAEIQQLYLSDQRPWIIGFSGGKDSTTILSLVYYALLKLPKEVLSKHIYVVSSDTLVETPVVVDMILSVLDTINKQAIADQLPITAHPVRPKPDQTFWVNLLGRGYPAPTQTFRWCTERMKINPVSEFILDKVASFGEVIVILGSRSLESASRAQVIANHQIDGSLLARHSSLPNAYTYMPIATWSADEVWHYLMGAPCPWSGTNQQLFELYKGSNAGECPLVIDTSTPSCGNSRFGCWTCTVVTKDKAIEGLVQAGESWMQPLLDFRNELHRSTLPENKDEYRNYKRRIGKVSYMKGDITDENTGDKRHIPGPYWIKTRKDWLKQLLTIEKNIRNSGRPIELIQKDELQQIRQCWLRDPNEPDWADSLPAIYKSVYGVDLNWIENDAGAFAESDALLLREIENETGAPAEMVMKLIDIEIAMTGLSRRTGILGKIETVLKQDWGTLEDINLRNLNHGQNKQTYKNKIDELTQRLEELSK
jgi:DNA sulfur modification protein DndC